MNPLPIEFQPNTLYPLPWLEKRLAGVMSVKTFLDNLGLDCAGRGRLYQNAVWGDEVLKAMDSTCGSNKRRETSRVDISPHAVAGAGEPKRKPGRPAKAAANLDPIQLHEVIDGRCGR